MSNDSVAEEYVLIVEDEPDFAALLQSPGALIVPPGPSRWPSSDPSTLTVGFG